MASLSSSMKPVVSVRFVESETSFKSLDIGSISVEAIGGKAFGLSCLPSKWTLPFIVISKDFLNGCRGFTDDALKTYIGKWVTTIIQCAQAEGVQSTDRITVRSSGCSENLDERGKFYSSEGTMEKLEQVFEDCVLKLIQDFELKDYEIPLVLQMYANPISQKGHLSNERRICKEGRDWVGETEITQTHACEAFQINLRNWRKKVESDAAIDKSLKCSSGINLKDTLEVVAAWAHKQLLRIHFEWVWTGETVYVVQADHEAAIVGVNPTDLKHLKVEKHSFIPKVLKPISQEHEIKYNKIRNVFVYLKLNLPTTHLYILEDAKIIDELASGKVGNELKEDLRQLVTKSLVIRMDLATDDKAVRQLLPRTHEIRDIHKAVAWLQEKSKEIRESAGQYEAAFIFHNFIPAVSSAFAYAAPGKRKVQIESLWGLPEGLYYNTHDKYVVDTNHPKLESLKDAEGFKIQKRLRPKNYFVAPNENGDWTSTRVKPPYDWSASVSEESWVKDIAMQSRQIAEEVGYPVSIMWFVGVPENFSAAPCLPWYHERFDPVVNNLDQTQRTKTSLDKSLVIKTSADVEKLKSESELDHSNLRRIQIQPSEEKLLRDKNTLKQIGTLAKKIDAIILMEGGVLSHAYYQLLETGAVVEVVNPFDDFEDEIEFNKLVRDKVPTNIEMGGEIVRTASLEGHYLLAGLKEKIVEEAFEVLDAVDSGSIVAELADVSEVLDAILKVLGVEKVNLQKKQDEKRDKAGGFNDGIVLLKTDNPLPSQKMTALEEAFLDPEICQRQYKTMSPHEIRELSHRVEKWNDKRQLSEASEESILNISAPIIRDSWSINTPDIKVTESGERVRLQVTCERRGNKLHFELSVFNVQEQMAFFKE